MMKLKSVAYPILKTFIYDVLNRFFEFVRHLKKMLVVTLYLYGGNGLHNNIKDELLYKSYGWMSSGYKLMEVNGQIHPTA